MAQLQSIAEAALAAEVQGAQAAAPYQNLAPMFSQMAGYPMDAATIQALMGAGFGDQFADLMFDTNQDSEMQMDTGGLAAQFPDLAQWGLGPGVVMTLDQIKQIIDMAGSSFIQAGS